MGAPGRPRDTEYGGADAGHSAIGPRLGLPGDGSGDPPAAGAGQGDPVRPHCSFRQLATVANGRWFIDYESSSLSCLRWFMAKGISSG